MMLENFENSPKIFEVFRLWRQFWNHLIETLRPWCVFVATCFSKPLGCTPLDRCWPPLGHPWSDFLDLLGDVRSSFAPNVKKTEQQIAPTTPSTKQARTQNNYTDNQSKQLIVTFVV